MMGWLKRPRTADQPLKEKPLLGVRYVVVDTEMTSLNPRTNQLLSIGAIAMQGASIQIGEQFYRVVNRAVTVPAETVVIHKLRSEDLKGGENLKQVLEEFSQFIAGAVFVGHFVQVDLKILRKEMAETGHKLNNPAICTARVHQWLLRQGRYSEDLGAESEKFDLATLAKSYDLEMQNAHHALSDAFLTARLWQKMLYALQARKVDRVGKLMRIGGAK